ncbi:MAG: cell division protein SepF [Candidatus Aenigmarchaeota archaeon]|nr:cell division protein SepF [Candidatus Aenigmarchaeota archaeon]
MPIRGFLQRMKGNDVAESVDYIELDAKEHEEDGKIKIKVETLSDFQDTERIQNEIRAGHIVWVRIKPLKEKDMTELKRAVDRLRKTCIAVNGDIAGIDEDFVVLTPSGVAVHRG